MPFYVKSSRTRKEADPKDVVTLEVSKDSALRSALRLALRIVVWAVIPHASAVRRQHEEKRSSTATACPGYGDVGRACRRVDMPQDQQQVVLHEGFEHQVYRSLPQAEVHQSSVLVQDPANRPAN